MRIHVLQHLPLDDAETLAAWCDARGHVLTRTHLPEDRLPPPGGFDLLVVLGGLMSAYEAAVHPWLREERAFLGEVCERGTRVLGLCLGAQLLADALGGESRPHDVREIGWHEVRLTAAGRRHPLLDLPERLTALQWHGDTFDLPPGAVRLAESEACASQAFAWRDNVLACQFHLEYSAKNIEELLEACHGSWPTGPYVQRPETIVPCDEKAQTIRVCYRRLLDAMASAPC